MSKVASFIPFATAVLFLQQQQQQQPSSKAWAFSPSTLTATEVAFRSDRRSPVGTIYAVDTTTPVDEVTTSSASDSSDTAKANDDEPSLGGENSRIIRPIHQNWWPVATLGSLDPKRPNAVELLNQKLVLFQSNTTSKTSQGWTCLDDRCSHRFAPLSEGRVVPIQCDKEMDVDSSSASSPTSSPSNSGCESCPAAIQCAYHGWEFDSTGSSIHVPQLQLKEKEQTDEGAKPTAQKKKQNTSRRGSVTSYPVRVMAGMVFVWADPSSYETIGQHVDIVVPEIAKAAYEMKGDIAVFQRDLPYGYELLGENLLDLSHLPFSHHSVGGLDRESGGPIPFVMLPDEQKSPDGPLYEVDLPNAADLDPTFLGMKSRAGPNVVPPSATLRVGFYQPNHVRYTRTLVPGNPSTSSYVILYLCPTGTARSRVFLLNVFGVPPPKKQDGDTAHETSSVEGSTPENPSLRVRLKNLKSTVSSIPKLAKQRLQSKIMSIYLAKNPTLGHEISHQIFDGDGVFLNKQGDRMERMGLTYRDYDTPTPADVLVNAFRRYLTTASTKTTAMTVPTTDKSKNLREIARAALPSSDFDLNGNSTTTGRLYDDDLPRSVMLDRYESHTKNCPACRDALAKGQRKDRRLETLQTVMTGAIGATVSLTTVFGVGAAVTSSAPLLLPLAGVSGAASCIMAGAAVVTSKVKKNVKKKNQKFIFEDWVHADND